MRYPSFIQVIVIVVASTRPTLILRAASLDHEVNDHNNHANDEHVDGELAQSIPNLFPGIFGWGGLVWARQIPFGTLPVTRASWGNMDDSGAT